MGVANMHFEYLWRAFPKTVAEFDEAFPDEEACRMTEDFIAGTRED